MFCFSPLWKFMILNHVTKEDIKKCTGLENIDFLFDKPQISIDLSIIDKICKCYSLSVSDIFEYVSDEIEYKKEELNARYIYNMTSETYGKELCDIDAAYFDTLSEGQKIATILRNKSSSNTKECWEHEKYWLLDNWEEKIHAELLCIGNELADKGYTYKQIDEILSVIGNRLK